ncbi:MAG: 30S ribosomal protein S6 [Patescibacteria group bacterium]|nr:30S ribosomal protein S6 [Patescibacteria group bacterium]
MPLYELTYLISPEISEEEVKKTQEKINSVIQEKGGIIIESKKIVKKKLGYPVRKKDSAFLGEVNFRISPEKMGDLEKKIKEEVQILRYIILAKKEPKLAILPEKPPFPIRKKLKPKPKVELKEIEKKLEEILGE